MTFDTDSYHFHSNVISIIQQSTLIHLILAPSNHLRVISLRNDLHYSLVGHSCYEWLWMTTDILRDGMTRMRHKWDEWQRKGKMRWSLRQPNRHILHFILMSLFLLWPIQKPVYIGDDRYPCIRRKYPVWYPCISVKYRFWYFCIIKSTAPNTLVSE